MHFSHIFDISSNLIEFEFSADLTCADLFKKSSDTCAFICLFNSSFLMAE